MARQKVSMKNHEQSESLAYERMEDKMEKRNFMHEGEENVPDHRKQHFKVGKHAIQHRDTELYSPKF